MMNPKILEKICANAELHAKWLNTLSYLENCGARKISACLHPRGVDSLMLKHAAEESRHAFFLKSLINKHFPSQVEKKSNFESQSLFAAKMTYRYLDRLEVLVCRLLRDHMTQNLSQFYVASVANSGVFHTNKHEKAKSRYSRLVYLVITYIIEIRAEDIYPRYQEHIKKLGFSINIRSLINEEKGHLQEMVDSLNQELPNWKELIAPALRYEELLFQLWCRQIESEVAMFLDSTNVLKSEAAYKDHFEFAQPISNSLLSH
ncbi:MAG: hypothetical protein KBD78_00385 [Oligoflexales bacterium]|nr:hypothetical protein [Oligoflexales bacterium]